MRQDRGGLVGMQTITNPKEIEKKSMQIIEDSLPGIKELPPVEREIAKRVIHTTGDLKFAVVFNEAAASFFLR